MEKIFQIDDVSSMGVARIIRGIILKQEDWSDVVYEYIRPHLYLLAGRAISADPIEDVPVYTVTQDNHPSREQFLARIVVGRALMLWAPDAYAADVATMMWRILACIDATVYDWNPEGDDYTLGDIMQSGPSHWDNARPSWFIAHLFSQDEWDNAILPALSETVRAALNANGAMAFH